MLQGRVVYAVEVLSSALYTAKFTWQFPPRGQNRHIEISLNSVYYIKVLKTPVNISSKMLTL